ncbi:MAG: putative LPS assembly protein LptD [Gemmatimonadota bacterium]
MTSRAAARVRGVALGWALVAAACLPGEVAAQEPPQPDSVQERIRERLRRLARPVGADSVLFQEDSIRLAEAAAGVRPGVAGGPDSVVTALSSMPGFTLTRYEGAGADFTAQERILVLRAPAEGRAKVSREGIEVEADSSITFDESTGLMRTVGMATFTPPDNDPVDAANMIYDLGQARGSATGARTEFSEGGTQWFMTGDMPWAGQDSTFMSHARFTSCDLDEPHYHFESDQVKVVGGRILVARGVRLYFADVPVAWLPFIAQDLEQGRASGLLTPSFSINDIVRTSRGYRRRISNLGFYWAMSDYTDAVVAFDWFSDAFVSARTAFQYRLNRHFLNGGANVTRYWGADGSRRFAFDSNHDWQPDERTRLNIAAQYANSDFVREFSFDTREVTQSITSNGGMSRRFDWGNLSVNATRNQYLSDDRVEWTLPQTNLSFTSRTLFQAPVTEARFWNNMTWSATTGFSRSTVDRLQAAPDTFTYGLADTERRSANASTTLGLGKLSVSPSLRFQESLTLGVPNALLPADPDNPPDPGELLVTSPAQDIAQATISWRTSVRYQQPLVGSTTITPDISFSGDLFRADTSSLAADFVSAPARVSFGATLKSDIYGFFPGVGPFDAIRHKLTPSVTYAWTPEATPSELQRQVFGSRGIQPKNVVQVTINQTFEARRRQSEEDTASVGADVMPPPSADSASISDLTPQDEEQEAGAPRRIERPPVTTLLGLTTSAVRYDFVEADSVGQFLAGFETVQLRNQINSDYLRGLSVSMSHDLFADSLVDGALVERRFRPHLASLNLGFSLSSRSGIFRLLGFGGDGADDADEEEPLDEDLEDPFADEDVLDQGSIIPGRDGTSGNQTAGRQGASSGIGEWNASLQFSLRRPRGNPDLLSRMISGTLRVRPTENWDLSWRTAYDLEASAFNDHVIRLTRDLHRWQAHFDFIQTVTGNWSFRFEVALTDNRDLKFDYRQRNLDVAVPGQGPS